MLFDMKKYQFEGDLNVEKGKRILQDNDDHILGSTGTIKLMNCPTN